MLRAFLQRLARWLRAERGILRANLGSLRGLPVVSSAAEVGSGGSPRPSPVPPPAASETNRLRVERDILRAELDSVRRLTTDSLPGEMGSDGSPRAAPVPPPVASEGLLFKDWVREQVAAEPYFFQKIALGPALVTPGWSDPAKEKLPYYGLPGDLTGARVLDIGCAEGFFSFEAERRGAREVVAIDSFPDSIRRFNLCRAALGARATAYLANVYELSPRTFGTFDLVLFYGVLYHLRHPHLALEKIRSVCTGTLLFQTLVSNPPALQHMPMGEFHPHGLMSGKEQGQWDPTVFWVLNGAGCVAMLEAVGFTEVEVVSPAPQPFVLRAKSPFKARGLHPDQTLSPWS
jgi:tRNA (mo5U34)-methyltransferase